MTIPSIWGTWRSVTYFFLRDMTTNNSTAEQEWIDLETRYPQEMDRVHIHVQRVDACGSMDRVHRDQARRQTRQSLEPGYPRRSNHPGIQETTSTARDPPPRQSASSRPPPQNRVTSISCSPFSPNLGPKAVTRCRQRRRGEMPLSRTIRTAICT